MGRDKYENEELIRYGWPEDLWFHVDKLSSAHVYLRLPQGETLEDVPPEIVEECAQLTKFNSIEGCKLNNVSVVYTMWSNLRKDGSMATGQVGFHNKAAVKRVVVEKRINAITNRLNKTKVEKHNHPSELAQLRAARDERILAEAKAVAAEARKLEGIEQEKARLECEVYDPRFGRTLSKTEAAALAHAQNEEETLEVESKIAAHFAALANDAIAELFGGDEDCAMAEERAEISEEERAKAAAAEYERQMLQALPGEFDFLNDNDSGGGGGGCHGVGESESMNGGRRRDVGGLGAMGLEVAAVEAQRRTVSEMERLAEKAVRQREDC